MELGHRWRSEQLGREALRLAASAEGVDPEARVPTCPDWSLAQLLRHVGIGYRWTAAAVAIGGHDPPARRDVDAQLPADEADLPAWLAASSEELVATLLAADPDAPMLAWGVDQHVRFWSRRILHETVVHRADVEGLLGRPSTIEPEVAADGIEEVLENLPAAIVLVGQEWSAERAGQVLALAADDGPSWLIHVGAEGFEWEPGSGLTAAGPTATVRGDLGQLDLLLYGRWPVDPDALTVDGDRSLVTWWLAHTSF